MNQYDLVGQISQLFRPRVHGDVRGTQMPTMTRYQFGANDGAAVYASRAPRRMPMVDPAPQPQSLLDEPTAPFVATNPSNPQEPPAAYTPTPMPRPYDINEDPNSTPTDRRLQAGTQTTPGELGFLDKLKGYGNAMQVFGRGQGGQSGGARESMYAPAPSVMSAGPVGGRAGSDVNLAALMRGNRRF